MLVHLRLGTRVAHHVMLLNTTSNHLLLNSIPNELLLSEPGLEVMYRRLKRQEWKEKEGEVEGSR